MNAPVVVAGAGPSGLTAACTLADAGVPVRVLDARPAPSRRPKAIVLWSGALEVLDRLGVADEIVRAGVALHRAEYHSGAARLFELPLTVSGSRFRNPVSVPQPEVEDALRRRLARLGGHVEWGSRVVGVAQQPKGVQVIVRDDVTDTVLRPVCGSWLIGADGASSVVRDRAGIAMRGRTFPRDFLLVDGVVSGDVATDAAAYHLGPEGVVVLVPLPGGLHRVFLDTAPGWAGERTPEEVVRAVLDQRLARRVSIEQVHWSSRFAVHARVAETFRSGRVLLAGDAAHVHSPAGGQGMNTGIQDGFDVAWRLAAVHARADERVLDGYDAERRPAAQQAVRQAELQTRLWLAASPAARAARDVLLRRLGSSSRAQGAVVQRLAQVAPALPPNPALIGRSPGIGMRPAVPPPGSANLGAVVHTLTVPDAVGDEARWLRARFAGRGDVRVAAGDGADLTWVRPDGRVGGRVPWRERERLLAVLPRPAAPTAIADLGRIERARV